MTPRSRNLTLALTVPLALLALEALASNVQLPNIGGGGDIKSTVQSKFQDGMEILGLVIGAGGMFAIGMGAFKYTLKQWKEGHSWMIGAGAGLTVGGLIYAIARFFV